MPSKNLIICPYCEIRTTLIAFGRPRPLQWQSVRYVTQMRQQRPARMSLSKDVPKSTRARTSPNTAKDRTNGPFGGMNRTHPGLRVLAEQRQKAQQKPKDAKATKWKTSRTSTRHDKANRQEGEFKALKMQSALSQVKYSQRSAVKRRISEIESFEQFALLPSIQKALRTDVLKNMDALTPTPIQRLAIPAILSGIKPKQIVSDITSTKKQYLLAAETGSGKTLAYAIPTIDAIKRAEEIETESNTKVVAVAQDQKKDNMFELDPPRLEDEAHPTSGRPRAIVLLPTSELVEQVGKVFKSFSHTVKLRVALISASYSATIIRNRLFGPAGLDVVICTPHLLANIAESDPNILSRVTHLIIDEADSLFDRSFAALTSKILDRATPSMQQLVLCSATIPRNLDNYLTRRFPDMERLSTPNLHAIPRRVQLGIVDIDKDPYRGNRDLACADAIWTIGRDVEPGVPIVGDTSDPHKIKQILVFVNERETANSLAEYLTTKGIDAVAMNRDTDEQRRGEVLAAFTSATPSPMSKDKEAVRTADGVDKRQNPSPSRRRVLTNTKVLVMTDLGSRGIDTVAVRNVILYDVPHTTIDFIHRLGRTGRMGRRGKGLVLVGKGDRKDVVREVREGMYRGQALI